MRNISEKLVEKTDRYVDYDLQTGPKSEAVDKGGRPKCRHHRVAPEWHRRPAEAREERLMKANCVIMYLRACLKESVRLEV